MKAGAKPQPAALPVRYCTRCREPIDPERVAHGSTFHSDDCRNADKRERRAAKAGTTCRLCGRRFTKPRRQTGAQPQPTLLDGCATGAQQPSEPAAGAETTEATT